MEKSEIGKIGECLAARNLESRGYKIIARNYRTVFGELDIVAKCVDMTLVFVEVKTMIQQKSANVLTPEDQMTQQKILKFKRIAQFYAGKYPEQISEKVGWRIDMVAVEIPQIAASINFEKLYAAATIRHYENI